MGFPQLKILIRGFWFISSNYNNVGILKNNLGLKLLLLYIIIYHLNQLEYQMQRYGDTNKSGRVGIDRKGNSIYGTGEDNITPILMKESRPSPTINTVNISQGNEGLSKKVSFTISHTIQVNTVINYF